MSDDDKESKTLKFTGKNWNSVASRLNDQLTYKGLRKLVDGTEKPPNVVKVEEYDKWERRNAKAQYIIKSVLREEDMVHIEELESAQEMMARLNTIFRAPGPQKLSMLQSEFYGMKYNTSIDSTSSRMTQLQVQMAGVKKEERPTDSSKLNILLDGLPEQYAQTAEIIRNSDYSWENAISILRQKELQLATKDKSKEESAHYANRGLRGRRSRGNMRGRGSYRGRGGGGNQSKDEEEQEETRECYNCGKTGHLKRDCWSKGGGAKSQAPPRGRGGGRGHSRGSGRSRGRGDHNQQSNQANKAKVEHQNEAEQYAWMVQYHEEDINEEEEGTTALLTDYLSLSASKDFAINNLHQSLPKEQQWVLDSGCSQHMTWDQSHFVDYKPSGGHVRIANADKLIAKGIGTVKVLFGGRIQTIRNVLHIPKLGYNLISMTQLTNIDMNLNVNKKTATIYYKGKRVGVAYRKGNSFTFTGDMVEGTVLISQVDVEQSTL